MAVSDAVLLLMRRRQVRCREAWVAEDVLVDVLVDILMGGIAKPRKERCVSIGPSLALSITAFSLLTTMRLEPAACADPCPSTSMATGTTSPKY